MDSRMGMRKGRGIDSGQICYCFYVLTRFASGVSGYSQMKNDSILQLPKQPYSITILAYSFSVRPQGTTPLEVSHESRAVVQRPEIHLSNPAITDG
jgi:hypothetical protein